MQSPGKKAEKFKPIVLKNGRSFAKIYRSPKFYTLCWRANRRRHRKVFGLANLEEAKNQGTRIVEKLEAGEPQLIEFSVDKLAYFQSCEDLAKAAGLPLIQAVEFGIALARTNGSIKPATPADLKKRLMAEKEQDDASDAYLKPLGLILDSFATRFKVPIHEISATEIDAWSRERNVSPRRRKNLIQSVRLLFNFAKSKDALDKDKPTEADRVTLPKVTATHSVEIFQVAEMESLLKSAQERLIPVLVLGAFCGVRTEGEMTRLRWEDIGEDHVVVDKQKLRGAGRRLAALPSNAKIWLRRCTNRQGRIWPKGNLSKYMRKCAEDAGIKWKHNALRHSFISYRAAQIQNLGQVALEAGNSEREIHKHYRELVTKNDAEKWFKIAPAKLTKEEEKEFLRTIDQ